MSDYRKPVKMGFDRLEAVADTSALGSVLDPAEVSALAHSTAEALIYRDNVEDQEIVDRLVSFSDEFGLDTLASLWSDAHPASLPGALWRLYLVRAALGQQLEDSRVLFQEGIDQLDTIDEVIAGAPDPLDATGFQEVLDDVLRGAFTGNLAHALDRAAAIARAISAGSLHYSWINDQAQQSLTKRSLNWSVIAGELSTAAKKSRAAKLN